MARRKSRKQQEETLVDIREAKDSAQMFFEKNQNLILGIVGGLIILVGGYLAYKYLYIKPRQKEAVEQMYQAQFMFDRDSFARALTNPGGGFPGFRDIIDQYSGTKAGNTAHYYAGISYLNLGQFDKAIEHLEDFDPAGKISPIMKYGALGDAYSELQDWEEAMSNYEAAVDAQNNEFLTPYYMKKLALLYEYRGQQEEALTVFKELKQKYPNSKDAENVEKYITRLEASTG